MRLHNRALVAVILSLAGFYSCSRQATIPTQLTYTPVPVFTIPDSLLATSRHHEMQSAKFPDAGKLRQIGYTAGIGVRRICRPHSLPYYLAI